jgi:hypothetical protein
MPSSFAYFSISTILNKTYNIDDLPAPVLPTIPTLVPDLILKFNYLKA